LRAHTHTHTYTHTRTHTHTHTYAHTYTHTYTNTHRDEDEGIASYGMSKTGGACLLCACPLILAATFWIESQSHVFGSSGIIMWFARFFRVGSMWEVLF